MLGMSMEPRSFPNQVAYVAQTSKLRHGPPPPGGDIDRGPHLILRLWFEVVIAFGVLLLRLLSRRRHHRLMVDDWLMIVAWVSRATDRSKQTTRDY